MSQVQAEARPATLSASVQNGVRHLWMPSQRSLCDLAVRRFSDSPDEIEVVTTAARKLPACRACITIAEMLARSAENLFKESGRRAYPNQGEAYRLLGSTVWPWVTRAFDRESEEES